MAFFRKMLFVGGLVAFDFLIAPTSVGPAIRFRFLWVGVFFLVMGTALMILIVRKRNVDPEKAPSNFGLLVMLLVLGLLFVIAGVFVLPATTPNLNDVHLL